MRDGKGIPNSKFEMRKLEENAHAKAAKDAKDLFCEDPGFKKRCE